MIQFIDDYYIPLVATVAVVLLLWEVLVPIFKYLAMVPIRLMALAILVSTLAVFIVLFLSVAAFNGIGKSLKLPWLVWITEWANPGNSHTPFMDGCDKFWDEMWEIGQEIVPTSTRSWSVPTLKYLGMFPLRVTGFVVFVVYVIGVTFFLLTVNPPGLLLSFIGKRINVAWMYWIGDALHKDNSRLMQLIDGPATELRESLADFASKLRPSFKS